VCHNDYLATNTAVLIFLVSSPSHRMVLTLVRHPCFQSTQFPAGTRMILHNNQEDTTQQQKEWKLACTHVKVYTGTSKKLIRTLIPTHFFELLKLYE